MDDLETNLLRARLIGAAKGPNAPHSARAEVPVAVIEKSPAAAQRVRREGYDGAAANLLLDSVREHGILQPLVARVVLGDRPRIELVAGERRLLAAERLRMPTVPCVLFHAMTDAEAVEAQLVENLQREDLDPLAEAEGLAALAADGASVADMARRIGKSRSHVHGRLKLRRLSPEARQMLAKGEIDASAAVMVARVPNAADHARAARTVRGMTARMAQQRIGWEFMLDVRDPPWGAETEGAVPGAGWPGDRAPACAECPRRTGAMPDEYRGSDPNLCTDEACYRAREKAVVEAAEAEIAAAGGAVAPADEVWDGWQLRDGWVLAADFVERAGRSDDRVRDFVAPGDVRRTARITPSGGLKVDEVVPWAEARPRIAAAGGGEVRAVKGGSVPGPKNPREADRRRTEREKDAAAGRAALHRAYVDALGGGRATTGLIRVPAELARRLARIVVEVSAVERAAVPTRPLELLVFLEECAASWEGVAANWCAPADAKALEARAKAVGVDVAETKKAARLARRNGA